MGVSRQLYQLQEVDLEIESDERALKQMLGQLGEDQAVVAAQPKLATAKNRLEELAHQQRSAELDIDEMVSKITETEGQLYGGQIKNPKELTNLQHEVEILKAKRGQLEEKALAIMDQVEQVEADAAAAEKESAEIEAEWHGQQKQLAVDIEALKSKLSDLQQRRQLLIDEIDPQAVWVYDMVREQKGQAVTRVEQGICRGCRISLPVNDLQQVRSGKLVQCSSCGRILFQP